MHIVIPPVGKLRTLGDLVTFDKVTFKYRGDAALLLRDVRFSVPQGGRVAFVGAVSVVCISRLHRTGCWRRTVKENLLSRISYSNNSNPLRGMFNTTHFFELDITLSTLSRRSLRRCKGRRLRHYNTSLHTLKTAETRSKKARQWSVWVASVCEAGLLLPRLSRDFPEDKR